jgi:hypothetical protein
MPRARTPPQQIRRSLLLIWFGAACVFAGLIAAAFSINIPSGPYSSILVGPLLVFLGLVEVLVGALYIHQALSFLPESYPAADVPPAAVRVPEPP